MSGPLPDLPRDPARPDKHIDPETGIWPIAEWGSECGRGFVSDIRFQRGTEPVLKRTSRKRRKAKPK
jgi:hypothetical protein